MASELLTILRIHFGFSNLFQSGLVSSCYSFETNAFGKSIPDRSLGWSTTIGFSVCFFWPPYFFSTFDHFAHPPIAVPHRPRSIALQMRTVLWQPEPLDPVANREWNCRRSLWPFWASLTYLIVTEKVQKWFATKIVWSRSFKSFQTILSAIKRSILLTWFINQLRTLANIKKRFQKFEIKSLHSRLPNNTDGEPT